MKPKSRSKARQSEFRFLNRGGKRRGAGRKPRGKRAGVSHATRPKLSRHEPALVTLRLVAGLPTLRMNDTHELIRHLCSEYHAPDAPFRVVEYSVQSNHLHLIVEANDQRALAAGMNSLASRLGKRLNKLWRRRGAVLADRYHSEPLRSPRQVRNALVYVLQNARKHGCWEARVPDAYSSGPDFDGWLETGAISDRQRTAPRTWLLRLGWRRHGLIALHERPARAA
jgi:REP element-mobilizing transposase RayT